MIGRTRIRIKRHQASRRVCRGIYTSPRAYTADPQYLKTLFGLLGSKRLSTSALSLDHLHVATNLWDEFFIPQNYHGGAQVANKRQQREIPLHF